MAKEFSRMDRIIMRLTDGTVKQHNLLTGTETWTIPGRGNHPLSVPYPDPLSIDHLHDGHHCAFCDARYLGTPLEKSRFVVDKDGSWREIAGLPAGRLSQQVAEFRCIPNLLEIASYSYWHLNRGHILSEFEHRRTVEYLASLEGHEHIMRVARARIFASGVSAEGFEAMGDSQRLRQANGFFFGGHDLIVARRYYVDGAMGMTAFTGSGTLVSEEYYQYMAFTAHTMNKLYGLDEHVRYVATLQSWLRPAGASFDHLHKQLVTINDLSVQAEAELNRLRPQLGIRDEIPKVAAIRRLLVV